MADGSESSKNMITHTQNFSIRGHLLRWNDTAIQISNISMVSTAPLPAPRFPVWSIAMFAVGFFLLFQNYFYYGEFSPYGDISTSQVVGIVLLFFAVVWVMIWYSDYQDTQDQKYLHLFLNSGNVYSFVFRDQDFMKQVLQLLANIIEMGTTPSMNFNVNIHDCNIKDSDGNLVNVSLR